uniref:Uncharacterized protein n=1 Tax=Setaria digitata TaxID=48799 RepID=A0A915PFV1_9BILA
MSANARPLAVLFAQRVERGLTPNRATQGVNDSNDQEDVANSVLLLSSTARLHTRYTFTFSVKRPVGFWMKHEGLNITVTRSVEDEDGRTKKDAVNQHERSDFQWCEANYFSIGFSDHVTSASREGTSVNENFGALNALQVVIPWKVVDALNL